MPPVWPATCFLPSRKFLRLLGTINDSRADMGIRSCAAAIAANLLLVAGCGVSSELTTGDSSDVTGVANAELDAVDYPGAIPMFVAESRTFINAQPSQFII